MRFLALSFSVAAACALAMSSPATAADDAAAADQAFLAALAKGDKDSVARMIGADFSWVTGEGEVNDKAKTLAALDALHAADKDETDVQAHAYGGLATVRGVHNGMRFLRIWANRDGIWQAFATIDTPVSPRTGPASVEAQAGRGDCDNPCRTVPYQPTTAMDKAILETWQKTKMVEWKPDAKLWASYIADEFMIVNNTTVRSKPEREAIAKRQEQAGVGTPGDPILSMRIVDFGPNAAVMFSKHFPVRGGKPYNNIRVWVRRDDRWQLAISQQSEIKAAAAMPGVGASQ